MLPGTEENTQNAFPGFASGAGTLPEAGFWFPDSAGDTRNAVTDSLPLAGFMFSDKTATDTDSESEEDYINGARNQPNKVTLTVMETDITQSAGWASRMMNALEAVKRSREVCQVITPLRAYDNMLLTDFTVTQDETTPYGWSGTLVFTETNGGASTRRYSNSSRITDVAAIRAYDRKRANRSLSQSSLRKMLQRAGIR